VTENDSRSLAAALRGDGRFLLVLSGAALVFSGAFAILQSLSGQFLPHDALALGMDAQTLGHAGNRKLVHFMFHDRVAFGGALLAIGFCYAWLAEFPLKSGHAWAWWSFACSGGVGFASFLAYLGYGYLDQWHAVATLFLLPAFLAGLWWSRQCLSAPLEWRQMFQAPHHKEARSGKWGRGLLLACAGGLLSAGATIVFAGMTFVFVPQDLDFMGIGREQIARISPQLVPVIAHDRAGFGGGLCSIGLLVAFIAWHAPLTRSFVEIMLLMGLCGFGAALGVHFAIGYLSPVHLAPAYLGFGIFLVGVLLCGEALRRAGEAA
jgi:hypothetical protein